MNNIYSDLDILRKVELSGFVGDQKKLSNQQIFELFEIIKAKRNKHFEDRLQRLYLHYCDLGNWYKKFLKRKRERITTVIRKQIESISRRTDELLEEIEGIDNQLVNFIEEAQGNTKYNLFSSEFKDYLIFFDYLSHSFVSGKTGPDSSYEYLVIEKLGEFYKDIKEKSVIRERSEFTLFVVTFFSYMPHDLMRSLEINIEQFSGIIRKYIEGDSKIRKKRQKKK